MVTKPWKEIRDARLSEKQQADVDDWVDEEELPAPEFLRNLGEKLADVPAFQGVDHYHIDRLREIATEFETLKEEVIKARTQAFLSDALFTLGHVAYCEILQERKREFIAQFGEDSWDDRWELPNGFQPIPLGVSGSGNWTKGMVGE